MKDGLVYVFTGEGKGKTSVALGVSTRSLLNGEHVIWIAFYKQESWGLSESKLKDKFSNLEMLFVGKGFRIGKKTAPVGKKGHIVVDTASDEEHRHAAKEGLKLASKRLGQKPFLLVMDEVLNAVTEGLIESEEVLRLLSNRSETHVILTGRGGESTRMILEGADLVTECKKIKHPYDRGELAVKGLDF